MKSIVPEGKQIANLLFNFLSIIFTCLALRTGLEPALSDLEDRCLSIRLTEHCLVLGAGFEPAAFRLSAECYIHMSLPNIKLVVKMGIEPTFIERMKLLHYLICDLTIALNLCHLHLARCYKIVRPQVRHETPE